MNSIELVVLWTDDDGMLQLGIRASSAAHTLYHETYVYPDALAEFGKNLTTFPLHAQAAVMFECGSKDPKFNNYLRLRAFVLRPTGHSALEIESEIRGVPPSRAESHFFIAGMPADFNRLGSELAAWSKSPDEPIRVEWKDG